MGEQGVGADQGEVGAQTWPLADPQGVIDRRTGRGGVLEQEGEQTAITAARAPDELVFAGAFSAPATFGAREVKESGSSDLYGAKWRLSEAP
jgi:hypothetical protein